ncbi:hypothetical protein K2173_001258 [Erythroxylum novogranatense]|uniref:Uncharacterized protein n=1 Tax=Erythroxylum novogranatense TaxID=1862640 RepID=A0AAV8T368_9ROSI|nr:hypothetical protein K2173_001258 [Erythroxylum novogranatense]
MQGSLNVGASKCIDQVKTLEESLQSEILYLKEELTKVVVELVLCKREIAQGGSNAMITVVTIPSKVDILKPKAFKSYTELTANVIGQFVNHSIFMLNHQR